MRATPLAWILGLASILVPQAAAEVAFTFASPANFAAESSETTSEWIFILLDGTGHVDGTLELPADFRHELHRESQTVIDDPYNGRTQLPPLGTVASEEGSAFTAALHSTGVGSIYVEAARIQWNALVTHGTLETRHSPCLDYQDHVRESDRAARYESLCPGLGTQLKTHRPDIGTTLTVSATGVTKIEFHNVFFDCDAETDCAPQREIDSTAMGPVMVESRNLTFHQFVGDGSVELHGVAATVLGGATSLTTHLVGEARFPKATNVQACIDCVRMDGETLWLAGSIELSNLTQDGRLLTGTVDVDSATARLDETVIDPKSLSGREIVAASAAGAGILVVAKLLLPLFTRLTKEQALEHPRRKQIFEYIQHHPGANFREVARNTGIAAGTVRHHLNVLERSGQVVEHSHGSTVRLFENHGKFDHNWSDLVLLREPALGKLYEWLKAHPGSPQKAVLEAMEAEQWSRSTTQHRLSRLVDGGVASIRLQGRLKLYSIVDRPSAKPPGLSVHTRSAYPAPLG